MSGELILKRGNGWKRTVPAVLAACVLAGGVTAVCLAYLPLEGLALAVCAALIVYVLFRVLYPACGQLFSGGDKNQTISWQVTAEMLYLDGKEIPRDAIKMVHCWPNRDALGHADAGWTVNIETTGKNQLLRSLTEGAELEQSVAELRKLVTALGGRWPEEAAEQ